MITKAIIYARVSTGNQSTERQVKDLTAVATKKGWEVVEIIEEVGSGAKKIKDRPGLMRLMESVSIDGSRKWLRDPAAINGTLEIQGKPKRLPLPESVSQNVAVGQHQPKRMPSRLVVMVTEISRLGRKTSEVLHVAETMKEKGISIYIHSLGLETLSDTGKMNAVVSMMFTMLAEFAQMEREFLRDRIKSGLDNARSKGQNLGRPKGAAPAEALLKKYPAAVRTLQAGESIRRTAEIHGISPGTVQRIRKAMQSDASKGSK